MSKVLSTFGGRKFTITLIVLFAAILAGAFEITPDADLLGFIKWIVGLYFLGNVSKGVVDKIQTTPTEAAKPPA